MARGFGKGVGKAGNAALIVEDGDTFHEVGDGDTGAAYGDIDRSGRGAVTSNFLKGVGRKGVYDDLYGGLEMGVAMLQMRKTYCFHQGGDDIAVYDA